MVKQSVRRIVTSLPLLMLSIPGLRADELAIPANGGSFVVKDASFSIREIKYLRPDYIAPVECAFTLVNNTGRTWKRVTMGFAFEDQDGQPFGRNTVRSAVIETEIGKDESRRLTVSRAVVLAGVDKKKRYVISRAVPQLLGGSFAVQYRFSLLKPIESDTLNFEDDFIAMAFGIDDTQVKFELRNKTDQPLLVDWNQVSLVDLNGTAHKVTHSGVRLVQRNQAMPPTTVPPTARIEDSLVASDMIQLVGREWQVRSMLPAGPEALDLRGKSLSVLMPLTVNGSVKNYLFTFGISGVTF